MKISRPAIWILIAVWATILLVPSLRTVFRAQLQGSPLMPFSALPAPQGLNGFWQAAALRVPNDRDVLLQAALEPPVILESTLTGEEGNPPGAHDQYLPSPVFPGPPASLGSRETVRRLEALVEKFPDDVTILAVYLRLAYPYVLKRVPGEMNDAHFLSRLYAGGPGQSYSFSPVDYSTADLQRAISLATRGAQLEPDNGFFDWMKCSYLVLAWRDAEALQALERAAGKARFDDHILSQLQSEKNAYENLLNRPLVVEEKMYLKERLPLPHLSRYRKSAELITGQFMTAKRQGQHRKVLQMASALGRTGAKMRQSRNLESGAVVGAGIEGRAYRTPIQDELDGLKQLKAETRLELAPLLFRSYAMRHGRADVAAQAKQSQSAIQKDRETRATAPAGRLYGLPYYEWFASYLLWRLGVFLMLFLPLALLVPVVMWGLSQEPRYREQLSWHESTPDEIPDEGEVKKGMWACGGLWALGVYLVVGGIAFFIFQRDDWLLGWGTQVIRCFGDEMLFFEEEFWNLRDLDGAVGRLVALAVVPLLFGGLFAVWRTVAWQKLMNGDASKQPLWSRALGFLLTGFLVQSLVWLAFSDTESGFWGGSRLPLLGIILCTGALLLEQFLQWRKRNYRLETVRYGLRLLCRSLSAWLVVGSVLYLCTLILALPLRNRAEAKIDRVLAEGQVRMMKGQ